MRLGKRVTGLLLAACLAVGMTPTMAFAEETESKPAIMLGTSGISAYDKNSGKTDTIYYGVYTKDNTSYEVPWYVLELITMGEGEAATKTAFMLSKYTLGTSQFLPNYGSGFYNGSTLQSVMNGLYNGEKTSLFTETERKAIYATTSGSGYGVSITDARLFPLSGSEASNLGWGSDILKAKDISNLSAGNVSWWLRTSINYRYAECVGTDGCIVQRTAYDSNVDDYNSVRPAFNLKLSSVLFSSKADDTIKSSALSAVGTGEVTEWELTILDNGKSVGIQNNKSVTKDSNGTITVPYTYSDNSTTTAETVNQISVMITDQAYDADNAKILYYGKLDTTLSTSGEGTFTLPEELKNQTLGASYHLYILAEHVAVSGESKTDYASAPVEITSITDVPDTPVTPDTDDSNNSSSNTDTGSTSTETTTTETAEPAPITITYTVKKDDYMRKIAREHGITLEQLIALNPQVKNPNLIYAGQVLVISTTGGTAATTEITATKTYTVLRGDSLYKIARQNGMTLAELKSLNETLFAQKYIYAGQQVLLK